MSFIRVKFFLYIIHYLKKRFRIHYYEMIVIYCLFKNHAVYFDLFL